MKMIIFEIWWRLNSFIYNYIAMEIISKKKVGEVFYEELKPTDLVGNTK